MPIYEYKGQLYELSTNDPAEAKRKIQSSLGEGPSAKEILGGTESSARKIASRAALADTALNAVTGLFDLAARVPATAYEYATGPGGFNEAYERASKNVGQAVQPDFFGRRLGITKTPEYSQALQRQVGEKVSQAIGENVITPVSEATGVHPGAVGDILNIGAMAVAPAVPKVAAPVVQAGKKVITPPIDIAKGLYQGVRGVEPGMPGSAVVPLREQYYPPQAVQQFMRNEIGLPELRASQQPSSSLFATAEQQAALRRAETMPGEPNVPLIPVQGQGMRAFGERIGREYVTDPLRAAADVGLSLIAGIPVPISAAQRAMQARQSRTLSQAAQFDPNFRQKLLEAERIEAITPSVAGPVAPQQVRQPQPIPTENQMMLPLTSTITPKAQDFMLTPGPGILGPKQISMQAAAERIQPVLQLPKPTMYSGTQGITGTNLPQVEQANFMAQFPPYPPKPAQKQINQPVAGPVAPQPINRPQPITAPASTPAFRPSNVIKQEINQLDDAATTLREKALSENVKPDTPEGDIYRGELDKLTNNINLLQKELINSTKLEKELVKKQQKQQKQTNIVQPKTVQPSNVSQMLIDEGPTNPQRTIDILKGEKSYPNAEQTYKTIKDYPEIDNTDKMQIAQSKTLKNEKNIKVEQVMLYDATFGPITTTGGYDTHIVVTSPQGKATKRYGESKYNYNELGEPTSVTIDLKDGTNIMLDVVSDYIELRKGNQTGIWSDGELIAAENLLYPDVPNVLKIVDDLEYGDPVSLGKKLKKPINLD